MKTEDDSQGKQPNRIKDMREAVGMTQLDLALAYGTSDETIRRYEAGDRDINIAKMINLAEALSKNSLGIKVEPFEILVSTDEIINKKAPILAAHLNYINSYMMLDEDDRRVVDRQIQGLLATRDMKGESSKKSDAEGVSNGNKGTARG